MNSYRRKVRAHQHALAQYAADMDAWRAPLVYPEPPAEPRLPYPVQGAPVYCSDCGYAVKAQLSKLDGAACVYLRESDGFRGQTDQAKVSGSDDPGSLSPTIDDLDDLDSWLRSWKGAYLGADTMARQGTLPDSITLGTAWLVVRSERILAHPDMAQAFGEEVAQWYGKLVRYDPSEVVVERLKGVRCPECKGLTLERKVGDDKVTCRMPTCERILKLSEYKDLVDEAKQTRKAS
jgi:DNA-directed RNA polymerase subunit RPC12/RpoP